MQNEQFSKPISNLSRYLSTLQKNGDVQRLYLLKHKMEDPRGFNDANELMASQKSHFVIIKRGMRSTRWAVVIF